MTSSGKPSRQNLRKRIRSHFRGNAYGSTLRLTLGCLSKTNWIFGWNNLESDESILQKARILSEWMGANAYVAWIVEPSPWLLEDYLIRILKPPLNLQGNENHPFYSTLSQKRKLSKQKAKRDIHGEIKEWVKKIFRSGYWVIQIQEIGLRHLLLHSIQDIQLSIIFAPELGCNSGQSVQASWN